ncbi:asparagine synthase-related protein [Rhizobium mongolense]|uniref:asparagine synthase-related protein n=1 Tax=Rhizobium mongolense TaxID=57676 RepID=UPI0035573DC9
MLIIAPHAYFSSHSPEVQAAIKDCEIFKNERFSFFHDRAYAALDLIDGHALMSGTGFCDGREIRSLKGSTRRQLLDCVQEAVGFFTIVLISSSSFTVISSLYRHRDIFYWQYDSQWLVTDDLAVLDNTIGRRSLNIGYVRDFVLDNLASGPETIFEGVYQVELGTSVTFSGASGIERAVANLPSPPKQGLAEMMVDNIRRFAAGKNRVIVRFSGGLDSSLILALTKEALGGCEALHTIIPEESQNTEVDIAQSVARQLGCELKVLHSKYMLSDLRKEFRGSKRVTSPFDVYPFSHDATDRSGAFLENFEHEDLDRTLFLSGQGGDNVFVQNPSPFVVKDALFEHGPIAFAHEAVKFSRLKNTSILDVMRKAFGQQAANVEFVKRLVDAPSTQPHLMLEKRRQNSAKYYHVRSVLEALQQYETCMEFGVASLHPLLLQNVISSALNVDPRNLYSERYDRMPQRQLLHARYKVDVAWRRTKKAATSAVFLFFMNNKDLIHDTLVDGVIAPALRVDRGWLRSEINYNGTIAITDYFAMFFNMLRLEIFCRQHSAKLKCYA